MRKKLHIIFIITLLSGTMSCRGQQNYTVNIDKAETSRILNELASDDMRGRNALITADIDKAASYIENEFRNIGLKPYEKNGSFYQEFDKKHKGEVHQFKNVIGLLPGKEKINEFVIFSAHYDHIGILPATGQDSIANGADDNASGVTALIQLARHYAKRGDNARTIIFVAFTGEEIGFYGSQYFSDQINPQKVIAMFNLEMIGKQSKFGANTAYLTGFRYSDLGKIMERNLKYTHYKIYPDPYATQQLFYRSDNMPLAKKGVPAHTISTVQINKDSSYHTVADEVGLLDVENIISVARAIAIGASTVVWGQDTPSRIKANRR